MSQSFLDLVSSFLGGYQPLAGDGIASINFTWIVSAILFILLVWFLLKLILRLIQGTTRGGR